MPCSWSLADIEPANGYGIMQALGEAIGGSWRPSPGAIYPAILSLQDAGLITASDEGTGSKTYRLTDTGRQLRPELQGTLVDLAHRSRQITPTHTLGSLLDAFTTNVQGRHQRLDDATARSVNDILRRTTRHLDQILNREQDTHG